ncbi:hypothetical protein Ddye_013337 [Dipteronia dyeriana]|uniref:DNA-directed RNA polymerase III subunit RPC4 n=1 Tax=Dipteronia dyeriana TaxID=168575 RepID=A0AAD9X691_9ROSI|nr:hypothetical protein Ddye_013337 [Dipteronia dyeriana]
MLQVRIPSASFFLFLFSFNLLLQHNTPWIRIKINHQHQERRSEPKKEDDAEVQAHRRLLRQFNEAKTRQRPNVKKTSSVQVSFGPGASSSSSSIRTFGVRKDGNGAKGTGSRLKHSTSDDRQIVISSSSTAKEEGSGSRSSNALALKVKKDYREPWDYAHTYYPTTLPWRPPYSGDPELLDEAEFGEATRELDYVENAINATSDLSLLDDSEEKRMMLFQFPANLPLNKRPASIKGKEKVESSLTSSGGVGAPMKAGLNGLSGGYMGKLLIYQSGAVKLKLGDTLYDVSPGSDGSFAQDIAAINTKEKNCCVLGEIGKRAVVAPDIDSLFLNLNRPK